MYLFLFMICLFCRILWCRSFFLSNFFLFSCSSVSTFSSCKKVYPRCFFLVFLTSFFYKVFIKGLYSFIFGSLSPPCFCRVLSIFYLCLDVCSVSLKSFNFCLKHFVGLSFLYNGYFLINVVFDPRDIDGSHFSFIIISILTLGSFL